jgi:Zn finger protein HypA/HybF involved in hydrogenase expression
MEENVKVLKCPKCGSHNLRARGAAHTTGAGEPMRPPDKHLYECEDCGEMFNVPENKER